MRQVCTFSFSNEIVILFLFLLIFIDFPGPVKSVYKSALTPMSHRCNHPSYVSLDYYCEVIEITVIEAGISTILSESTMKISGFLLGNNFTLLDLSVDVIKTINVIRHRSDFEFSFNHKINNSFILIVIADQKYQQGNFSIFVNGPNNVTMKRKGEMSFFIFF